MAEESGGTGANKLQAQERTNHECTLYSHSKDARGGEADTTPQGTWWPRRRRRGRDRLSVLDVGPTRERSKTASTAPCQ